MLLALYNYSEILVADLGISVAFTYLSLTSEVLGSNPVNGDMWHLLKTCPDVTLAVEKEMKFRLWLLVLYLF